MTPCIKIRYKDVRLYDCSIDLVLKLLWFCSVVIMDVNKLKSACNNCMKILFGYSRPTARTGYA